MTREKFFPQGMHKIFDHDQEIDFHNRSAMNEEGGPAGVGQTAVSFYPCSENRSGKKEIKGNKLIKTQITDKKKIRQNAEDSETKKIAEAYKKARQRQQMSSKDSNTGQSMQSLHKRGGNGNVESYLVSQRSQYKSQAFLSEVDQNENNLAVAVKG